MKTIERILLKILIVQGLILLCVQLLFHFSKAEPYLSKVVQYEGVNKMKIGEWIETFKP
ncbi:MULTISPECIES: YpfB family protein [Bacillus]|uniref:YpfB family protein n=1 Tax=Bacillus TaxID=1386 RepID=UPI00042135DE|nr:MULTISPECIES: YpfB family protein [Bacillus]QHZ47448.1 YpfB family protein [Bacillus sp. NSP9.1]WFA03504.1 YpfB family protein [Bacillus sp. HSf4]